MPDSPLSRYHQDLQRSGFVADESQLNAVRSLDELYHSLVKSHDGCEWKKAQTPTVWRRLKGVFSGSSGVKLESHGLYFWGGVGRGKTYLMDVFFECLPFDAKMRTHFHRFMRRVHQELTSLTEQQDPLEIVAGRLAKEARVICFDEFFVVDITDAMILAGLLEGLFARGVVLVATSNIAPGGLYENGLQRARFLPAIALLHQYTQVVNVDGGVDYRLRVLEKAALYYVQGNADVPAQLMACFHNLLPDPSAAEGDVMLEIEGRHIEARYVAEDVVWFQFAHLCDGPRSQNDYIELAREYHAVIVEGVPYFDGQNDDLARRFIYLVDEFYDRNVKVIVSAVAPAHQLYRQGRLGFEFERTVSRLQEMQSSEYLSQPHKA
ncbi:cell division protein ZapE [Teredinibacter purpureus]|uniref:cell division protein ZapE n=1 Tax=Teredinibacter purpureus TaxID=2731756 RepID=UPI0005F7D2E9|nr:cell division protein ZapE [Teredinibacter purpureus]